jgi:hypothetical protein
MHAKQDLELFDSCGRLYSYEGNWKAISCFIQPNDPWLAPSLFTIDLTGFDEREKPFVCEFPCLY